MKNRVFLTAALLVCIIFSFASCGGKPPVDLGGAHDGHDDESFNLPGAWTGTPSFNSFERFFEYVQNKEAQDKGFEISEEAYIPYDILLPGFEFRYAVVIAKNEYSVSCKGMNDNPSGLNVGVLYAPEYRNKSIFDYQLFVDKGFINDRPLETEAADAYKAYGNGFLKCTRDSYDMVFEMSGRGEIIRCNFKIGDYLLSFGGMHNYPLDETAPALVQSLRDSRLTVELIQRIEKIIEEYHGTIG